jgi:hypothetical protein
VEGEQKDGTMSRELWMSSLLQRSTNLFVPARNEHSARRYAAPPCVSEANALTSAMYTSTAPDHVLYQRDDRPVYMLAPFAARGRKGQQQSQCIHCIHCAAAHSVLSCIWTLLSVPLGRIGLV